MKKLLILSLAVAMLFGMGGVGFAAGYQDPGAVNTTLIPDTGNGEAPVVKSKWEMKGPSWSGNSFTMPQSDLDDDTDAHSQFLPPLTYQDNMDYTICAVVTDPDSFKNQDIAGVYADIYYPDTIAYHPEDPSHPDEINGGTNAKPDFGLSGCSDQIGDELMLKQLTKDEGYHLFCDVVRNYDNGNLPYFYDNSFTLYQSTSFWTNSYS